MEPLRPVGSKEAMAAARGVRVLPLSRGIRVQSHFPELTTTREYVDHGSATMIVLLDAKASRNALLDLCVLRNMKTQHDI